MSTLPAAPPSSATTSYLNMKADKTKVPVAVFLDDIAASGGYWIECSGYQVFANKSSILGSLGVICSLES